MLTPLYVFSESTATPAFRELEKEGKADAWYAMLGQVVQEQCTEGETIITCVGIGDNSRWLGVRKYPSMEAWVNERAVTSWRLNLGRYFDLRTTFGWKAEDWSQVVTRVKGTKRFDDQ